MGKKSGYVIVAIIYLLGLFMGALDTGIVTPGRTVIQNDLGVDDQLGVWLITIYTLAYAAAIPFMGKMADRVGRKPIYLLCVILFGLGSFGCGMAKNLDSFTFLLISRVVQAIGGGGIMPIATAEFGTTFPPEKRGLALGLTGGVYGVASVFGASIGSLVLDLVGQHNWQFIFYINIPICAFIIIAGIFKLHNNTEEETKPIDILGTIVLVIMVLSLMYGLRMLDFSNFVSSLSSTSVYPFLLIFVVLLPVFVFIEKRAADPIINLSYFTNRNIVVTLCIGMITGIIMMGSVFVPQFAENALYLPSGKGGYWVILLGVFAGVGSPMSGKLIDKFGVKPILGFGLVSSVVGALFLAFVAAPHPSIVTVIVSFVLIGTGMGFIKGTPVNYMMLANTDERQSNSALATLSLMRSMGTAVAPTLMVAFLATSGALVQDRIMDVLPHQIEVSQLPYQQEVSDKLDEYKNDPDMADMLAEAEFPDLESFTSVEFDMLEKTGKYTVPDDVLELMKTSDLTTIVDNTKTMTRAMFAQIAPDQIAEIQGNVDVGMGHIRDGQAKLEEGMGELQGAIQEIGDGISGMDSAIAQQKSARKQLVDAIPMVEKAQNYKSVLDFVPEGAKSQIPPMVLSQLSNVKTAEELRGVLSSLDDAIAGMEKNPNADAGQIKKMKSARDMIKSYLPTVEKVSSYSSVLDLMPSSARSSLPSSVASTLSKVKTVADLNEQIASLDSAMGQLRDARSEMRSAQDEMRSALSEMQGAQAEMDTLIQQITVMREAIPAAFDEVEEGYLAQVDERGPEIERVFQLTLGEGFAGMFLFVAAFAAIGIVLLLVYDDKRPKDSEVREQLLHVDND